MEILDEVNPAPTLIPSIQFNSISNSSLAQLDTGFNRKLNDKLMTKAPNGGKWKKKSELEAKEGGEDEEGGDDNEAWEVSLYCVYKCLSLQLLSIYLPFARAGRVQGLL